MKNLLFLLVATFCFLQIDAYDGGAVFDDPGTYISATDVAATPICEGFAEATLTETDYPTCLVEIQADPGWQLCPYPVDPTNAIQRDRQQPKSDISYQPEYLANLSRQKDTFLHGKRAIPPDISRLANWNQYTRA